VVPLFQSSFVERFQRLTYGTGIRSSWFQGSTLPPSTGKIGRKSSSKTIGRGGCVLLIENEAIGLRGNDGGPFHQLAFAVELSVCRASLAVRSVVRLSNPPF
jgi:hypothetical protein